MKVPFFNTTEFLKQLTEEFGDPALSSAMMGLHDQYQFCAGLIVGMSPDDFFSDVDHMNQFQAKYGIEKRRHYYDVSKMEEILVAELGIEPAKAAHFTRCEERYLTQIGVM